MKAQRSSRTRPALDKFRSPRRPAEALVPRRVESARQIALTALRNAIQWGELAPGERISEADIAKRLGLSRTPVREASQQLASEGLLETVPRVGSFVRRVERDEIDEVYQLKTLLDPVCTKMAAKNLSEVDANRLTAIVKGMERFAATGDVRRMGEAVDAFHDLILQASGSRLLPAIYGQIDSRIRWLRRRNLRQPGRIKESLAQHRAIARAVAARDAAAAELAARRHMQDARRHILAASDGQFASAASEGPRRRAAP